MARAQIICLPCVMAHNGWGTISGISSCLCLSVQCLCECALEWDSAICGKSAEIDRHKWNKLGIQIESGSSSRTCQCRHQLSLTWMWRARAREDIFRCPNLETDKQREGAPLYLGWSCKYCKDSARLPGSDKLYTRVSQCIDRITRCTLGCGTYYTGLNLSLSVSSANFHLTKL